LSPPCTIFAASTALADQITRIADAQRGTMITVERRHE
jgi:hypothetical protein